jgi:hypothetical protein
LQKLIRETAINNTTWGEERIADELLLKIGIQVSLPGRFDATCLRNHIARQIPSSGG